MWFSKSLGHYITDIIITKEGNLEITKRMLYYNRLLSITHSGEKTTVVIVLPFKVDGESYVFLTKEEREDQEHYYRLVNKK